MQNNIKYALFGATFIVSLGAAFLLTKTLKEGQQEEEIAQVEDIAQPADTVQVEPTIEESVVEAASEPEVQVVEKKEEAPKVSPMTAGEFQRALLNMSDYSILGGRNPRVAKSVVIHVKGGGTTDIQSVRDKIKNEFWRSASVVSVSHDSQGRVNAVTIVADKNDDEE